MITKIEDVIGQKRALAHYDDDLARGPAGIDAAASKPVTKPAPAGVLVPAMAASAPVVRESPAPKGPARVAIARRDTGVAQLSPARLPVGNAVSKPVPQPIVHSTSAIQPIIAVSHGLKSSPVRATTTAPRLLAPIQHDDRPPMGAPKSQVVAPKVTRPAMGSPLSVPSSIAPKHNVETIVMGSPKAEVSFKPRQPKQMTAPKSTVTNGMRLPG